VHSTQRRRQSGRRWCAPHLSEDQKEDRIADARLAATDLEPTPGVDVIGTVLHVTHPTCPKGKWSRDALTSIGACIVAPECMQQFHDSNDELTVSPSRHLWICTSMETHECAGMRPQCANVAPGSLLSSKAIFGLTILDER
jgi:hypothetical protein